MPVQVGYPSFSIQDALGDIDCDAALGDPADAGAADAFQGSHPDAAYGERHSVWGFALFVGIDELSAKSAGTSVCGLAKDIRDYGHALVNGVDSHAAVALGPAAAECTPIESVFAAFGDPSTMVRPQLDKSVLKRPAGVLVDVSGRQVFLDGDTVNLTVKEFELMTYLISHKERVVGRDELLRHVCREAAVVPNLRTIDVHVGRLRNKLGRLAKVIRSERGSGYQYHGDPEMTVCTMPEYMI